MTTDIAETQRQVAKSETLAKTASALMPGGVAPAFQGWYGRHDSTAPSSPQPVFVKGRGAVLTDADGNEYIDYIGAHGALVLGHADERVSAAIGKAASKGCGFGAPSETEVRLVELLAGRFASIDMLRLVNTPADAMGTVLALAYEATGRDRVLMFDGHALLSAPCRPLLMGSGEHPPPVTVPYNDIESVEKHLREHGATVAAVVVEPVSVSTGLIPPARGFLKSLRALCDAHGALLVFDETLTGIRLSSGGTATLYGVAPDLILLGSIVGGGLPIAAYGGCKEVMKHAERPWLASPTSGNLLGMAAGIVTLQALSEPGFYEALEQRAVRLEEGLLAVVAAANEPVQLARVASILGMFFSDERVTQSASARRCDVKRYTAFRQAMLDRGILLSPSPFSCIFVSAAHNDEGIDRTIEAAHEALRDAK